MTNKLNTFTGTWINEKLMRAKHDAEARNQMEKLKQYKIKLVDRVWGDVEDLMIDSEAGILIEDIINGNTCIETMMDEVTLSVPEYEERFVKHVYRGN